MDEFERAIQRFYLKVRSYRRTALFFRISRERATRICKNIPKKKRGRKSKLTPEIQRSLKLIVDNNSDLYIEEIREELVYDTSNWLSLSSMQKYLKKIGFTRKKAIQPAIERFSPVAMEKRFRYLAQVANYPVANLFFVDETGIDITNFYRRNARARRGQRGIQPQRYVRSVKYTILSCIGWNGIISFRIILNAAKTADFNAYIIDTVLPNIPKNSTIILDNASIHKAYGIQATVRVWGSDLLFLPPYSPDLNPIEISYSYLKKKFRDFRGLISESRIPKVVSALLQQISGRYTQAWYRRCNYDEFEPE